MAHLPKHRSHGGSETAVLEPPNRYGVDIPYSRAVDAFIESNRGRPVDITGCYGFQSPDLLIHYVRVMTGDLEWMHFGNANDWNLVRDPWFDRVPGFPDRGDVVVIPNDQYGTLGIANGEPFAGRPDFPAVNVFTQTPMVPSDVVLPIHRRLGVACYRLRPAKAIEA